PPSVLLIVYGATAGVSVVQLYAGAFFPGLMLAALYLGYVIVLAKWRPELMPPLPESERHVALPPFAQALAQSSRNAVTGLWHGLTGGGSAGVAKGKLLGQMVVALLPLLVIAALLGITYRAATAPVVEASTAGLVEAGGEIAADIQEESSGLIGAPEAEEEDTGLTEPPAEEAADAGTSPAAEAATPVAAQEAAETAPAAKAATAAPRLPAPNWFWILFAIGMAVIAVIYWLWNWERLEVFKMLLTSFFPLALLILAVLGSIVFGLATPTEAAAVGAFGGFILAAAYRFIDNWRAAPVGRPKASVIASAAREMGTIVKESSFLTAKTSAMVCWLFVGSAIFSAAFALLGGQEIINNWVLSLDMTPVQFMILAQFIIFILGWPLEWTEIIVIFMPIFIPLLPHFNIDPLFFGLLVALNLQTAFLSPPVAMAAFYLKGVAPPHVTLNQIFAGMLPFMGIQVVALALLYIFPGIGLWLPNVLYK
ncbi:MAG: TRAP transporter large permease subunit, partial [Betaproteobacteria bacterium]|nr:TRAP transporter large permease subunit [Betaproteobacteria bacterium]